MLSAGLAVSVLTSGSLITLNNNVSVPPGYDLLYIECFKVVVVVDGLVPVNA